MGVELLIGNEAGTKAYLPAVEEGIEWTTERKNAPGKLSFKVLKDDVLDFSEGSAVRMKEGGDEIFFGFVFKQQRAKEQIITVTAYDQLRYLKASASYCFVGRTAGQILTEIAQDFQLKTGVLDDTGYAIPTLVKEDKSCLDIISAAIQETLLATGKLYTFFDDAGALSLREAGSMVAQGVVGEGSLLLDYTYKTDIDEHTYNSIKLVRPNESTGRADVFQAVDSSNIGRWGLLQLYQSVDEALNNAQAAAKAQSMLSYYNRRWRTLKVSALGLPGLRAGQMLMMDVPNLGDISLFALVLLEKVTHTFENDVHTMDFEVRELGV